MLDVEEVADGCSLISVANVSDLAQGVQTCADQQRGQSIAMPGLQQA